MRSLAFEKFYAVYFEEVWSYTRGEIDLSFLRTLRVADLAEARRVLREALPKRQTHYIDGVADLGDVEAIPILREMYNKNTDLSWRLTLAGSLWRLCRDSCFAGCLEEMLKSENESLKGAHMEQILWLGDERALDLLVGLLDDKSSYILSSALRYLRDVETFDKRIVDYGPATALRKDVLHKQQLELLTAESYRARKDDPEFRSLMARNLAGLLRERDTPFNINLQSLR